MPTCGSKFERSKMQMVLNEDDCADDEIYKRNGKIWELHVVATIDPDDSRLSHTTFLCMILFSIRDSRS